MRDDGPILVPLDGSELAEGAVPYARALAHALQAELVLLTVWEGSEEELTEFLPSVAVDLKAKADEHYRAYLERVRDAVKDVPVRTLWREAGEAADEIVRVSEEQGARAIVVATHGRSGISRWISGSTSARVIRESSVPVVAVGPHSLGRRAEDVQLKHIMVPLDGGPSEQALPVARQLATALGARISLVRALPWASQAYPYTLPDAYVPQLDDQLEEGAKAYLRRCEESLGGGPDASAYVVRGPVADGLINFAEEHGVDLVVMMTHARTGIARAALGSTADRMLQANAPVLLLRPQST